jgi:hypothetical protein
MFDTEDGQINWICTGRHNPVLRNYAVLLASRHDFSGEQQQRPL